MPARFVSIVLVPDLYLAVTENIHAAALYVLIISGVVQKHQQSHCRRNSKMGDAEAVASGAPRPSEVDAVRSVSIGVASQYIGSSMATRDNKQTT